RRERDDLLTEVDAGPDPVDERDEEVQTRVERGLVPPQPLDDERHRLRHDADRPPDRDDREDGDEDDDEKADDLAWVHARSPELCVVRSVGPSLWWSGGRRHAAGSGPAACLSSRGRAGRTAAAGSPASAARRRRSRPRSW